MMPTFASFQTSTGRLVRWVLRFVHIRTFHLVNASVAVVFLILVCFSPAYSRTDKSAPSKQVPQDDAGKAPQETEANILLVTNNTAVVHFSPSRWDRLPLLGTYTANETVFLIRPIKENIPNAVITSSGLGNAVFIREDVLNLSAKQRVEGLFSRLLNAFRNIRTCPEPSWNGAPSLALSNLKVGEEVKIRMRFPCDLVSDPGDTLEGKILIIAAPQKPLEVPVKIQTPAASSFYTALLWFLGVVIPTLIGYSIYKLQSKWTEQRAQWAILEKYISSNRSFLDDFFTVHYKQMVESDARAYAKGVREEFEKRQMVDKIPPGEWRKLQKALDRCNSKAIQRRLAKFFPIWKSEIKGRFPRDAA